jgi:signal recognition particle subunit SRP68
MGLCEVMDGCDARTKLEVTAYWQWLNGNILFEQQSWQKSLDSFGDSRNIYQKLGNAVSDDQRSLYHQRVEEITPNIRYCAYNIGGLPTDVSELMKLRSDAVGSDMLSAKIDEVLAKTSEKAAVALTEVQWEGKSIPVKNEKIRVCLIKLNQMAREIEMVEGREERMEVFEKLLMEYQDAIQVVKDEIHQDSMADKKKSQKTEQLKSTYQNLLDYLVHQKLTQGIQRNLLLLETLEESKFGQKSAKPEEFVRVYDILLQQITELGDLQSSDLNQQKFLIGQTFYCKANRCYYLSETYTAMRKWMEGIALLERALEHNIQSVEHFRGCDIPDSQQYVSKLQKLREIIHGRKCELKVNNVLDSHNLEDSMGRLSLQDKPITSQLDYHNLTSVGLSMGNVTLSPIPSEYKPLPTKPLFFDLALDHIEFPPLAHRAEKRGGSGLTGFVKGLFWGKN